jgi:F0F1-type ATP synthase alpha subunit
VAEPRQRLSRSADSVRVWMAALRRALRTPLADVLCRLSAPGRCCWRQLATQASKLRSGDESVEAIEELLREDASEAPPASEGKVVHFHGGVSRISGLRDARMGGLVQLGEGEGAVTGLIVALERSTCTVALLSTESQRPNAGAVGQAASLMSAPGPAFPVGEHLFGRRWSPLGLPYRGGGSGGGGSAGSEVEADAPPHMAPLLNVPLPKPPQRSPVRHQLFSGLKVIDALHPLAHGHR